jgi:peptidoglycan hydrolase CwlO-like protein
VCRDRFLSNASNPQRARLNIIRARQERWRSSSIDLAAQRQSKDDLVMGTEKDSADKAKADLERVEAEEDEARAKSGQRPAKRAKATGRRAPLNQRIK